MAPSGTSPAGGAAAKPPLGVKRPGAGGRAEVAVDGHVFAGTGAGAEKKLGQLDEGDRRIVGKSTGVDTAP